MTQGITYRTTAHSPGRPQSAARPAGHTPRGGLLQGLRRLLGGTTRSVGLPSALVRDVDPDLHVATSELMSAWQRLDGHLRPSVY